MIGRITGTLILKQAPDILVDIGGIGYEVLVPMSTLYQLPEVGQLMSLHTHFVVREDAQILYGFHDLQERVLFRALIKVNGVGPKMALAILSGMEVQDFVKTVRSNDVASLVNMPGIGKKTAERLIVEMRDRLKEWDFSDAGQARVESVIDSPDMTREAETALISLGYKPQQASRAVSQALRDYARDEVDVKDSEMLIRAALKGML